MCAYAREIEKVKKHDLFGRFLASPTSQSLGSSLHWGKDAREASLPGIQTPGRQKSWGLPGLKAQTVLLKGKYAFSADMRDSIFHSNYTKTKL